ncbi:MAG: acetate/propionate family kinase [Magnetococcales bacterium]|nr:acetate/propionate family kinase [Magnetococcales bacterium]
MKSQNIAVLNAGSSSLKFSLFELTPKGPLRRIRGQIAEITSNPVFSARIGSDPKEPDQLLGSNHVGHHRCLEFLLAWLERHARVDAAGHRVVHGGIHYSQPVILDAAVITDLEALIPLAPLHQPHNLEPIRALATLHPGLTQVACFDTAFHATKRQEAQCFPLPATLTDAGVRRYGFHGLSYEYIAMKLKELDPDLARGRVVVAHLGNGASMCAIDNGKCVDSTMGMTAADGLPMGTRSGTLDPGVLLYMARELNMSLDSIEDVLYRQSGLKGISGISHDMRQLEQSDHPKAARAIALMVYRIQQYFGALTASLGGLDGAVFTAGIGENSSLIRRKTLQGLHWLGFELDEVANTQHATLITTRQSKIPAYVLPTDEDVMIAHHVQEILDTR